MGKDKKGSHRNFNGLHQEELAPPIGKLSQLPPPKTPFDNMKVLLGKRSAASLLAHTFEQKLFL